MDDPLFQTSSPRGGYFRQPTPPVPPTPSSSQPKKVVSIPIRFVGSEKSQSDSGLKIQKAFRGFRVRKNVQKILAIRREIDIVEKKLQERETVGLIMKDDKVRLKMNETLMALLFKLDSVRSVNDSVRDCRKAAIKKAIMLQEKIDFLVAEVNVSDEVADEASDSIAVDNGELKESTDACGVHQVQIPEKVNNYGVVVAGIPEKLNASDVVGIGIHEKANDFPVIGVDMQENVNDSGVGVGIPGKVNDSGAVRVEIPENGEQAEPESWECVGEVTEEKSDFAEVSEGGSSTKRSSDDWYVVGSEGEESKRSRKLLEKMAEDNQKLMAMVSELCQRNATQASLISSLSQRVEQLEKAMNDSLRKKKKKKKLDGITLTTAP